jgi:hypothetical protein
MTTIANRIASIVFSLTVFSSAFLAVGLATALPARADDWSKNYTLSGKPELRVETSDAAIRVTTWDQSTIAARVEAIGYKIGEGGITIDEHQSGDRVEIGVHYPHRGISIGWSSHRVEITIQMPREGRVNLRTGDGSIDLASLKGETELHTGDGAVTVDDLDGKLHAETGDGRIRASGRFDELELHTGDGRVDVHAAPGSALASAWRLETGDGSVTLEVPPDLAADVDLHTNDGHVDLDLPVTSEGIVRHGEVHGKINGGGNLLIIRTGDGSIHLRKK